MPFLSRIELAAKQEGISQGRQQTVGTLREMVMEVLEMRSLGQRSRCGDVAFWRGGGELRGG